MQVLKLHRAQFLATEGGAAALWVAFRTPFPSLCGVEFGEILASLLAECPTDALINELEAAAWDGESCYPGGVSCGDEGVRVSPFVNDRHFVIAAIHPSRSRWPLEVTLLYDRPSLVAAKEVIRLVAAAPMEPRCPRCDLYHPCPDHGAPFALLAPPVFAYVSPHETYHHGDQVPAEVRAWLETEMTPRGAREYAE